MRGYPPDTPIPFSDFLKKRRWVCGEKYFINDFLSKKFSGEKRRVVFAGISPDI